MYKNILSSYFIIIIIFILLSNTILLYSKSSNITSITNENQFHFSDNTTFSWPIPGFHNITSNFGIRVHPISKKTSSHSGIDISASSRQFTLCHKFWHSNSCTI